MINAILEDSLPETLSNLDRSSSRVSEISQKKVFVDFSFQLQLNVWIDNFFVNNSNLNLETLGLTASQTLECF